MSRLIQKLNHPLRLPLITVAFAVGILLGRTGETAAFGWAAMALSLALVAVIPARGRFVGPMSVMCAAGFLMGYQAFHPQLPPEGDYSVQGVVADVVTVRGKQHKTVLCDVRLNGQPTASDAYWSFYSNDTPEGLRPGVQVSFEGELYHPSSADNPGGMDFRGYLLSSGIEYALYGFGSLQIAPCPYFSLRATMAALRDKMTKQLASVLDEDTAALAAAMILGDRSLLPEEDRASFTRLGIAHILSVSGFHTGILAGVLLMMLKKAHAGLRLGITAAVLAAYCMLTGGHVPVIRASCLILLSMYGRMNNRRVDTRWVLCAAMLVTLVINPAQIISAGFQLTYGAVLGISIVTKRLNCLLPLVGHPKARKLWQSLAASAGAQFGILLPQLYWFHELPLMGLVLNLFVLPFAGLLIVGYWVVLVLCPVKVVAAQAGKMVSLLTRVLLSGVRLSADDPVMMVWTKQADLITAAMWGGMLLLLCMSWRKHRTGKTVALAAMAAVMCLSLCPAPHHGTEYIQLSVGNADAAVLLDENTVTVIDTGEDGEALTSYLHAKRRRIDTLLITHLHLDHVGGVANLLDSGIPIEKAYLPWGAEAADGDEAVRNLVQRLRENGTEIITLGRGDVLDLPSGQMTVLWPEKGKVRPGQDANESSLVCRAELHGSSMLLTGDLDGLYEAYAAAPADLLKVAHHGSFSSTSLDFAQKVSPLAAVVSAEKGNRVDGVRERLSCPVYATGESGAVTVVFENGGFKISTAR